MDSLKSSAVMSKSTVNSSKVDPARKYGKQDPTNMNNFTCNYCDKVTRGGVYRFKQHLVGGFSDVTKCRQCPEHVRKEIKVFMTNKSMLKKDRELLTMNVIDIDDEEKEASHVLKKSKMNGGSGTKFASTVKVFLSSKAQDGTKARKEGKHQTINEVCHKELRKKACKAIAKWFYDADIPFNAVKYDSFRVMIELIGQFGPGMKPPSMYELSAFQHDTTGPILLTEIDESNKSLMEGEDDEFVFDDYSLTWIEQEDDADFASMDDEDEDDDF